MELRLLEYFLAVCEELHFTRAAEKLGISQPTLSHQIKLLENQLDTVLFQRSGKQIQITESGMILLEHSMSIFQKIKLAKLKINELKEMQRGKLSIGCSGNHLINSSIISFHDQFPKIELSVVDTTTEDSIEKTLTGDFDLAVTLLPVSNSKLVTIKLTESQFFVISSIENSLAQFDTIGIEQLQNLPLFLLQKNFMIRQTIDQYCKDIGTSLKPIVELSDVQSLLQMTIKNKGITILPSSYVQNIDPYRIKLIHLSNEIPKTDIGIIYPKNTFMSQPAEFFISHLVNNYK
jgi:LysR family transcriptional regulator, cyn operon transcriptional activator